MVFKICIKGIRGAHSITGISEHILVLRKNVAGFRGEALWNEGHPSDLLLLTFCWLGKHSNAGTVCIERKVTGYSGSHL